MTDPRIELDQAAPAIEGLPDGPRLSRADNERYFKEWVASEPQGPLDEVPEFP